MSVPLNLGQLTLHHQRRLHEADGSSGASGSGEPVHRAGQGGGTGTARRADRPQASSPGPTRAAGAGSPGPWGPSTPLLDPRSLVIGLPLGEGAFSHVYEGVWLCPAPAASWAPGSSCGDIRSASSSLGAPGGLTLALRSAGTADAPQGASPVAVTSPQGSAAASAANSAANSFALPAVSGAPIAVAIKVLKADRQGRSVDCYRLIREAQVLARLSHRNIVGCYGIGRISDAHPRHPSALFIVQQLVQGLTLAARVHMAAAAVASAQHVSSAPGTGCAATALGVGGPVQACAAPGLCPACTGGHGCAGAWYGDELALGWMLDVAEGLQYLHNRQGDKPTIMHRDLKLENIMLNAPDGRALLVDFGLHRELDARTPRACMRRSSSEATLNGASLLTRASKVQQHTQEQATGVRTPQQHPQLHPQQRHEQQKRQHEGGADSGYCLTSPCMVAPTSWPQTPSANVYAAPLLALISRGPAAPLMLYGPPGAQAAAPHATACSLPQGALCSPPPAVSAPNNIIYSPPAAAGGNTLRPALKRCLSTQMSSCAQDVPRLAAIRAAAAKGSLCPQQPTSGLLACRSEQALQQLQQQGYGSGTSATGSTGSSDGGLIGAVWSPVASGSPVHQRGGMARRSSSLRVMWKDLQPEEEEMTAAAGAQDDTAPQQQPLQQQQQQPQAQQQAPQPQAARQQASQQQQQQQQPLQQQQQPSQQQQQQNQPIPLQHQAPPPINTRLPPKPASDPSAPQAPHPAAVRRSSPLAVRPSPFSALARVPVLWRSSDDGGDAADALDSPVGISPASGRCGVGSGGVGASGLSRLNGRTSMERVLSALRMIGLAPSGSGCLLSGGAATLSSSSCEGDDDDAHESASTAGDDGDEEGGEDSSSMLDSSPGGSGARLRPCAVPGVDSADSCPSPLQHNGSPTHSTAAGSPRHLNRSPTRASRSPTRVNRSPTRAGAISARQPSIDKFVNSLRTLGAKVVAGIGGRGRSVSVPVVPGARAGGRAPQGGDAGSGRACEKDAKRSSVCGVEGSLSHDARLTSTDQVGQALPQAQAHQQQLLRDQLQAQQQAQVLAPVNLVQLQHVQTTVPQQQQQPCRPETPPQHPQRQQQQPPVQQPQAWQPMSPEPLAPSPGPAPTARVPINLNILPQPLPPSTPAVPLAQRRSVLVSPLLGSSPSANMHTGCFPNAPNLITMAAGPSAAIAIAASVAPRTAAPATAQASSSPHVPWTAPSNMLSAGAARTAPPTPWAQPKVQHAALQSMQQQVAQPAAATGPAAQWLQQQQHLQHYLQQQATQQQQGRLAQCTSPLVAQWPRMVPIRTPPPAWPTGYAPISSMPTAPAATGTGTSQALKPGCTCAELPLMLSPQRTCDAPTGGAAAVPAQKRRGLPRRCSSCLASEVRYNLTEGVGSWCYMAPEVLLGQAYNESADTFSFAVVMYEVFSRRLLLSEQAAHAPSASDARRVAREWAQRVAQGHRPVMPPSWPEELRDLIADCWAQDASERPPLGDVLVRLRELRDGGSRICCCTCAGPFPASPSQAPQTLGRRNRQG